VKDELNIVDGSSDGTKVPQIAFNELDVVQHVSEIFPCTARKVVKHPNSLTVFGDAGCNM
jgi:hypothetical protein